MVVPLTPLIRDILEGSAKPLTMREIRLLILNAGVLVDSNELASAMVKLVQTSRADRTLVESPVSGRRQVWAYKWKKPTMQTQGPAGSENPENHERTMKSPSATHDS